MDCRPSNAKKSLDLIRVLTHNVTTLRHFIFPLNIKSLSVIALSFLILNNSHALGKRIDSKLSFKKLPSETCFELTKNDRWDSLLKETRIPQKFCVKSVFVEKVYTNQVSVRVDSNDIPQLIFGDIQMAYRNGEKRIALTFARQEIFQKGNDYFAYAKADLLFNIDKEGNLISEIDANVYVSETPDIQKSEGEFADLIFEKTVRK